MINRSSKLIEKLLSIDHSDDFNLKDHGGHWDHNDQQKVDAHAHQELSKEAGEVLDKKQSEFPESKYKTSLHEYSGGGYEPINKYLRTGEEHNAHKYTSKYIEPLKQLTRQPTKHTFNVYRAMGSDIVGKKRGDVFQDHGFTSASLRPSIVARFKDSDGTTNYRIRIRPGTRGHYIGNNSSFPFEKEFVLHPGTKFKVGKTFKHPNGEEYTDLHIHSQEN